MAWLERRHNAQLHSITPPPLARTFSALSYQFSSQLLLLTGFSGEALVSMQSSICGWLAQDLSCISVLRVIQLYLERLGHYLQVCQVVPGSRVWGHTQPHVMYVAHVVHKSQHRQAPGCLLLLLHLERLGHFLQEH